MLNKFKTKGWLLIVAGLVLWFGLHIPSIEYGTDNVPLYSAHIGDEQVPVNGALHVLKEQNILALRDANKAYYGPLMVMLAVPITAFDYIKARLWGGVSSAMEYRNHVVWDWGGILQLGRIVSVITGFVGLVLLFKILMLPEVNPKRYVMPALLITVLLATEYFYFHYTSMFRHWVYLNVILLGQIYLYLKMKSDGFRSLRLWLVQALLTITTFGMSYLGALFNLVWSGHIVQWLRNIKNHKKELFNLSLYSGVVLLGVILIVAWHPNAFFRIFGIVSSDLVNNTGAEVLEENYGTGYSFEFYGDLYFNNHLGMVLATFVLLLMAWKLRRKISFAWSAYLPVMALLVAYVLLFGLQSHHSTHYFLPAIVLIQLLVGLFFVQISNIENVRSSLLWLLVILLFGAQLAFNSAVITKLIGTLNTGPIEVVLGEKLLDLQEKDGGKVLLWGCGPIAVPHTRAAYADFASRAERYKTNLYSALLSEDFEYPSESNQLDAYYEDNMPEGERLYSRDYKRVVICDIFNINDDPNQRLIWETNLLNYWSFGEYATRYILKNEDGTEVVLVEGVNFVK